MKSEAVTLGELDLRPIPYPHQVHGLEEAVLGLVDFIHLHTLPAHHLLPHAHRVNAVKVHVRKIMRSFSSITSFRFRNPISATKFWNNKISRALWLRLHGFSLQLFSSASPELDVLDDSEFSIPVEEVSVVSLVPEVGHLEAELYLLRHQRLCHKYEAL